MSTELIINATLPETRIALLENGEIQELHIERDSERGIVGNIYKGKVIRVLPGMQAAFVDIGLEKAAFLYVDDIFFPEMRTPLVSHPLPEPASKPPVSVSPPGPISLPTPLVPGQGPAPIQVSALPPLPAARGRGRGGRFSRGDAKKGPVTPPLPGTPEAHAAMQSEYAKQMLESEKDSDGSGVVPQSVAEGLPVALEVPAAPIAAAMSPAEQALPEQPEARAPESAAPEPFEEEDDEEDLPEVYRPEPLIDADAWADDLASANEGERAEAEAEGEAAAAAPAADVMPVAVDADAEAAPPLESEPESLEAGGEVAENAPIAEVKTSLPAPLATPVKPMAVPVTAKSGGKDKDDDEDDDVSEMPRRRRRREPVNIADIIKEGQDIVVQVAKDPIGTKGARLTCHVSLPGRYLVFMPTVDHIGVSRRIESEGERRRLKETMGKIRPAKTGVIVRTASGKQTDRKLKADLDYLVTTWNDIQKKFLKQRTPSVVYQDLTIVLRAIRDMFTDEVDRVIVDSKREHKAIMRFVTRFIPAVKDKVELYTGEMPIFDTYGIETEISRALDRKVWLKSGGYLVVDQAEALVAIDVNTGRYVGKKTLEETILKTNLEAVKEIAYQLRLRNCGGIIILDLIDMEKESNKEKVYKALEEALKKDRARPSILKISQLGLVEMTRKRTRDTMVRSLCEPCSYCEGRGFVRNKLTIAYDIMRDIEREGSVKETQAISIQCHPSVADVLLEDKRDVLEDMEHQFNKKMTIRGNGAYHVEQYELMAHREQKNLTWTSEERKQQLRQKTQERTQQMASELRKVAEVERQEKRREQEDKRREQEKLRQERRAQAEERKRQAVAARAAALLAQGLDPNAPIPPGVEVPGLPPELPEFSELPEFDDELGALDDDGVGADGLPVAREDSAARADGQSGRRPLPQSADGKRRRRGRRGRGGRGRNAGEQAPGRGAGRSAQPAGIPNVRPVNEAGGAGPQDVGPGADVFPVPAHENLGPRELAGSAVAGDIDDCSQDVPEGAGGVTGTGGGLAGELNPDGTRRRRRGRRGGRRRRRVGPGGAPVGAAPGGEVGGEPRQPSGHGRHGGPAVRPRGDSSAYPVPNVSAAPSGSGDGGGRNDGGGDGGSGGAPA